MPEVFKPTTAREHADRARELIDKVRNSGVPLSTDQMLKSALVHATLAVAEATRTTNMIVSSQAQYSMTDDVFRRVDN